MKTCKVASLVITRKNIEVVFHNAMNYAILKFLPFHTGAK